jgi:hypothetical protein
VDPQTLIRQVEPEICQWLSQEPYKVCTKCKRYLPTDMFEVRKDRMGRPRSRCKDCVRESKKTERGRAQRRAQRKRGSAKLGRYKRSAAKRGIEWRLNKEQAYSLFAQPCHFCGGPGGGIDRYNNEMWYGIDNAVPCCTECNFAKWTRTPERFVEHCRAVVLFHDSSTQQSNVVN